MTRSSPSQRSLRIIPRGLSILAIGLVWLACGPAPQESKGDGTTTAESPGSGAPSTKTSMTSTPWFEDATEALGITFRHRSGFDGSFFMPEIMAPGVAVFDADGDGRLDILAVNGEAHDVDGPDVSDDGGPPHSIGDRLYRQTADGTFEDVTEGSGLGTGYGMGCAVGDLDNDGDLDVYITRYGNDGLYRNRGDGTFEDITKAAGIQVDGWSVSAGAFDANGDGWLDLYVVRYVDYDPSRRCSILSGQPDYCGPLSFRGMPDVLLLNRGDGTFHDASESAGVARQVGRGLGMAIEDFNHDGAPDIYVANDGEANQLWLQVEPGRFEDQAVVSGVAVNLMGRREASMGVAVGDVDGDARLDLFLTHLGQETNTLYLAAAGAVAGTFEDRVAGSGLGDSSLPYTGFGTALFDGDLDGDLDLLVANGQVRLLGDQPPPLDPQEHALRRYDEADLLYVGDGRGGFTLHDAPGPLDAPFISRGLVTADWDADGDLDAVISTVDGPLRLLRNVAPRRGHYLQLRLVDPALGRDAVGARVVVRRGEQRWLRTVSRATSYASSQPATVHIGLGEATTIDDVQVTWPDGREERFNISAMDRSWTLERGQGTTSQE